MKGVFVVIDGVGDEPCQSLGQITPLQAAKTPNLDVIAKKSKMDYCYPVKKDFVPESSEAVISLLGYDYLDVNRGPFEALGLGIKLNRGDLALRCNFATIDDLEKGHVLDRRAGRTLTTKEAKILAKAINKNVKLPFEFEFYPAVQHRGVLVIRGGFSDNISDIDGDVEDKKLKFSEPLDDEDETRLAANLVNQFVRHSYEVLDNHPINVERARKGLFAANVIFCRGAGNVPARFKKIKGKWMALGYMPLEIGIAKSVGMDVYKFRYPKLKSIDVYACLYSGLKYAVKYAVKMLKKYKNKYDYFYIHFKEPDLPGHDNKPHDKVNMIEYIDKYFFSFLKKFIGKNKLVVTGDHTTSCRLKSHTADPVPVLVYPHPAEKESEKRFIEIEGMKGRGHVGRKLLDETLFRK